MQSFDRVRALWCREKEAHRRVCQREDSARGGVSVWPEAWRALPPPAASGGGVVGSPGVLRRLSFLDPSKVNVELHLSSGRRSAWVAAPPFVLRSAAAFGLLGRMAARPRQRPHRQAN